MALLIGLLMSPITAAAATGPAADDSGALDARAAAARTGDNAEAKASGVTASWYSGTVAAGASQTWYWNNANPFEAAYQVGYSPVGATTGKACRFETVNAIYQRYSNGERKFVFTIKNSGTIACGTTVLLASLTGSYFSNTGTLSPGQSQTRSATSDFDILQLAGVLPFASGSTPCQIELGSTSHRNPSAGKWEFWFTVRNVGAVACSANLYLASAPKDIGWRTFTDLGPGETYYGTWNNANPVNATYLVMGWPFVAPNGVVCQLSVARTYYRQVINSSGFAERRFSFEIRNIGSNTCYDVHVAMATLAA